MANAGQQPKSTGPQSGQQSPPPAAQPSPQPAPHHVQSPRQPVKFSSAHRTEASNKGFTDDLINKCEAAGFDWTKIFVLVQKYGPTFAAMLTELLA